MGTLRITVIVQMVKRMMYMQFLSQAILFHKNPEYEKKCRQIVTFKLLFIDSLRFTTVRSATTQSYNHTGKQGSTIGPHTCNHWSNLVITQRKYGHL